MVNQMFSRNLLRVWMLTLVVTALCVLAGCGSISGDGESREAQKNERKDNRTDQEKVVILKQRFEQLESSLDDMEKDLKVQRKRIESTRELADSIRHSLTKGGLRGYNLDTVSTTDPVVLASIEEKKQERDEQKARSKDKEETDDGILNALLIGCFLVIIASLFWVALHDRKTDEQPLEAGVGGASVPMEEEPGTVDPYDPEITPGIDDTGSYQYGELGGPRRPEIDDPPGESDGPAEDRPQ